jgi:hypothetical protein
MKTAKKSLVGVVKITTSFVGVNKMENSDSIVKIVVYFLLGIILVLASNRFPWFRDWIVGRRTLAQIRKTSGYSERSLKRYFNEYLSVSPILNVTPSERVNLLIDGTYFRNDLCLIIYRDDNIKFTQLYRITTVRNMRKLEKI